MFALLAACSGGSATGPSASAAPVLSAIEVTISNSTLRVGQTAAASALGRDQHGASISAGVPVWSSLAPDVATVSATGVVSAVAKGQTMIIAAVGDLEGQFPIRVLPAAVARVTVSPAALTLTAGASRQLTASVFGDDGQQFTDRVVVWSSADSSKASVTSSGDVTARSTGVVAISATCEGVTGVDSLTVPGPPGSVSTVVVTPAATTLQAGSTAQLSALLKDVMGNVLTGRAVTWTATVVTGPTNMLSVSPDGLVTAVAAGSALVQATSEGQSASATITVIDAVDPGIAVSIAVPIDGAGVGDTLLIVAGVTSTNPLASVVASVGALQVTLVLTHVGALGGSILWVGHIDVTDLKSGPYKALVTATDITGARGELTVTFSRDTRVGKGGVPTPGPKK